MPPRVSSQAPVGRRGKWERRSGRLRLETVFVNEIARYLSSGVSGFVVAGVALGVEADIAGWRPVSDLA